MTAHLNYIGGKWTRSMSRKTFHSLNPATGKSLGTFQSSTKMDVNKAIVAAQKAFVGWSETPAPTRGEYLFEVARILKKRKEKLAQRMTEEMGKVLKEARGDVQEAIDISNTWGEKEDDYLDSPLLRNCDRKPHTRYDDPLELSELLLRGIFPWPFQHGKYRPHSFVETPSCSNHPRIRHALQLI